MSFIFLVLLVLSSISNANLARNHATHTCENIRVKWMASPPYVYKRDGRVGGILVNILNKVIKKCCQNNINITYHQANSTEDLQIYHDVHYVMPIVTTPRQEKFLSLQFVRLLESPGSVLYNFDRKSAVKTILKGMHTLPPLLLVMAVMISIVGLLYWIVEVIPSKKGEKRSVCSMLNEIHSSVWWAFITVATVGYGDYVPSKFLGRLLCFAWLIFGCIFIAIFTGSFAAIMIEVCFNSELSINGNKLAVIEGSKEQHYLIKKGGIQQAYKDMDDFHASFNREKDVMGGLFDLYSASYHTPVFQNIRIQGVVEHVTSYGVLAQASVVPLTRCLRESIQENTMDIYQTLNRDFKPLRSSAQKSGFETASASLFEPSKAALNTTLGILCGTLFVLSLLGLAREKLFLKKRTYDLHWTRKMDTLFDSLHKIKHYHQSSLRKNMSEMEHELSQLQTTCDETRESLLNKLAITDNLFRANIPIVYQRQKDVAGE